MPKRQDGKRHLTLDLARTVNPVRSLPARISLIVFGATLITSLAVTAISVRSIDEFLRGKIEQNFPTILESARQRLDLWYDQRLLELGVLSNSGILKKNVGLLRTRGARGERASKEVEQYLTYVLDGFPQYEALFVLGPDKKPLLWVGSRFSLPESVVQEQLTQLTEPRMSPTVNLGSEIVQLVSARLDGAGTKARGTLHAVFRMNVVRSVLDSDELSEFGEIFLLDASGSYLAASDERLQEGAWAAPTQEGEDATGVLDYSDYAGERVVGSTQPVERFGWTLAVEEPYNEAFSPVVNGIRRILGINLAIVLLFALAAFRVARSIAKPIEALSETAQRISAGEKGIDLPENARRDEVGILTRSFSDMTTRLEANAHELESSQAETQAAVERMRDQNHELQRMNEILEQLSITDGLTKLHNHRYFQEHLTKEVKRSARSGVPLSLILIDIDHFKMWNDRLGHSGGDDILRRIAEIMQQLTRGTDLLARYGGEEFALLLPATQIDGAVQLAEKIRAAIAETEFFIEPPSERQPVTVSIGVSAFTGDKRSLFDDADEALYRAKRGGRDCVMIADPNTKGAKKKKKKAPKKS
jgi:diguanylate cyclase (GGDEF)-like protein